MKKFFLTLLFVEASIFVQAQVQCDNDSTGLIPLIDLGSDYYFDKQGGLYPDGVNIIPTAHLKAGRKIAKSIRPLDMSGNVDWAEGKIVFIGMGASTAGNSWEKFMEITDTLSDVNPYLQTINACLGGKGMDIMNDTANYNWYWEEQIFSLLDLQNSTPEQVQIIWIKSGSKVDTIMNFPSQPTALADKYEVLMGILQAKFPNLKMVFISGFFYGGYSDPTEVYYNVANEPGSYWNSFAVKWVIERQILGDLDLKFKGSGKKAPFIAWGPYVWADGMNPNSTGLSWDCEMDFDPDGGGYHLSDLGTYKEALLIKEWAQTDPIVKQFFNDGPKWHSYDFLRKSFEEKPYHEDKNFATAQSIQLFPSPNSGNFYLQFAIPVEGNCQINIINNLGQHVWDKSIDNVATGSIIPVDIIGMQQGLYVAVITINGQLFSKKFILN